MQTRRSGFLLHPSSLPGNFPVGDFGPVVEGVLDWARDAGFTVWQVLPLGPPSFGDSPYAALSSFAGNPLLISPERLQADGLLPRRGLPEAPEHDPERVPFAAARAWKDVLLRAAFLHTTRYGPAALRTELGEFERAEASWLDDWALFASLKARQSGASWTAWPVGVRDREAAALADTRRELAREMAFHRFVQWAFFRQWRAVRVAAAERGIQILGDLPIYVSGDSADVWARRDLFRLDPAGEPEAVAGVPPDYFSPQGQRWGNPLYAWEAHRADGFAWWIERLRAALRLADVVRLDHFRGFVAVWEIAAASPTAVDGRWLETPGRELLEAVETALGGLPLVAEDLGVITPDVERLRDDFALPGMKVLQFAFGEIDGLHASHHHREATVVYTGTHDNDTTRGTFDGLDAASRERWREYVGPQAADAPWDPVAALIRAAYTSVARWAVLPAQDLFGLGSEARMNVPGRAHDNWSWRALPQHFDVGLAARLRRLGELSGRLGVPKAEPFEDAGDRRAD